MHEAVNVAPHAGAWIEINPRLYEATSPLVAPHAGAWIEIVKHDSFFVPTAVAPHAGAWIEISACSRSCCK